MKSNCKSDFVHSHPWISLLRFKSAYHCKGHLHLFCCSSRQACFYEQGHFSFFSDGKATYKEPFPRTITRVFPFRFMMSQIRRLRSGGRMRGLASLPLSLQDSLSSRMSLIIIRSEVCHRLTPCRKQILFVKSRNSHCIDNIEH